MMLPVSFRHYGVFPSKASPGWFIARIVVQTEQGQEITFFEDEYPSLIEAAQAGTAQLVELTNG